MDFLLVLIAILLGSVLLLRRYERILTENRRLRQTVAGWPKISDKRGRPQQPFFSES